MRPVHEQVRTGRRCWVVISLLLTLVVGAAACSGGDNILGTPQAGLFNEKCGAALDSVRADNGWTDADGVTVARIEQEQEGGIDVYGVELSNGVEIEFASGEDCRVLEIEHGDDDAGGDDDDDAAGDD